MKKILLIGFISSMFYAANAQVEKGSIFTGGSVGFGSSKNDDLTGNISKSSNWSLVPQLGKAIAVNKIVGIQLQASASSIRSLNMQAVFQKTKQDNFGLGIFYRQYFPLHEKWMLFGQATLSGTRGKVNNYFNDKLVSDSRSWSAIIGVTPGISFRVGKKVYLEAILNDLLTVNYTLQKSNNRDAFGTVTNRSKQSSIYGGANTGGFNSIAVGLRWIIPAKR